jgi:haloalkane dehalogenase
MRVDLDAMSATVQQVVAALDLRDIIMVGHDSGGLIGLHAAGAQAERYAGLVLVDTIGGSLGALSPIRVMLRIVSSAPARRVQARWNLLARAITTLGVRRRKPTAAERAALLDAYPDPAARCRPLEVFGEMARRRDFFDATGRGIARLRERPVLSIFGQFDPVRLFGHQRRLARLFPRHRSAVVRGEAHFVPEGAPEEMAAAIRSWWHAGSGGVNEDLRP